MFRTPKMAFAAVIFSLVLPVTAHAATKNVSAGPLLPKKGPAGYPEDADISQFFPASVKVHVGDTVKFTIAGFHAINFPKKGSPSPALILTGTDKVSGVKDALGADFWFNGLPTLDVNPAVAYGTKSGGAYTGAAPVASGIPEGEGKPKPWSVKLTKAGSFTYYCPIHPGMKGKVTVVAKSKKIPTAKQDAARVRKQLTTEIAKVVKLGKAAPPAGNVIQAGNDLKTGETVLRFFPASKTVPVNTPVTLTMPANSVEIHTFSFAKTGKTLDDIAATFPEVIPAPAGPPALRLPAQIAYPSDPPPALPPYDGSAHGDGYFNTGVLDTDPKSPSPMATTMTFSAPGTYSYICLIHPFMKGQVVVQ